MRIAAAVALAGCAPGDQESDTRGLAAAEVATPASLPEQAPVAAPVDSAEVQERLASAAAGLRATLAGVPVLTAREVAELRMDVNARQIATAQRLGRRVGNPADVDRLLRERRLVELEDSTDYWILRRMEHSVPYMTPDGHAMLTELGRRFHLRLDAAGLPRYRMRVTSVLRTDADQVALRRVNRNASTIVSAHEFGTTVDVSHERFAVPSHPWPDPGESRLPELENEILEEVGREFSRVLQAELGRAIRELRQDGILHVMMEDAQPVYHMTVARRLSGEE
jgi:hypothetical protein